MTKNARSIVGSEKLLHKYILKDHITVKVFKIDNVYENSQHRRWEDAITQCSGAEKFVAYFTVIVAIMNYARMNEVMFDHSAKSVLVMDNPFGAITSAHLLQPMFRIADHFNVQLICFSDITKSDVVNCFESVIKLKRKQQQLSNKEIMTHEGNELIEHGYYKVMNGQMSLF